MPHSRRRDTRKIRIYDFKRPDKFSKEQIRTVCVLHEKFAMEIMHVLSKETSEMCHVHVASVDQLRVEEFVRSVPTPSLIFDIDMSNMGGIILEIDPAVTYAIECSLLGGTINSSAKSHHELSDAEKALMTAFFSRISAKLTSCWKNVLETTPKLREIITNPAMILTSYQDEMSCLVTHEIKIGDVEGMMNICYPESSMYDVMDKLKYEVFYQEPKEVTNFFDVTKMPARVSMAVFKDVTVQDIIRLKKGDVLRFNGKLGLFVNGKRKFDCTLGKVGNNKAAKIEINRKEFEEMK